MTYIIGLAVGGLIVGALGRLALPGRQPMGCLATMLCGIAGSFLAGLVGRLIWNDSNGPGWILSILGAMLVVFLYSRWQTRRA